MSDISAIQGFMSQVSSTMAGLPSALAAAAPSGNFASVLEGAFALLDPQSGGAAGTTATPATPAATPTSVALGPSTTLPGTGTQTAPDTPPSGAAVASAAEKFLGVPYLWGGTTPSGFDCSGLVQYVYNEFGISLPRTSQQQALSGTAVPSLAAARPGDLVFYAGSDGTPSAPGHVGIYLGNGEMIDAPYSGTAVRIDAVGTPVAIRRVLPDPTATGSAPAGPVASTAGAVAAPANLAPLFGAAAAQYGVPASLLSAVASVESNFNPAALSNAGAEGLMQLMPQTAASLGVNPLDPAQAIDGAARLLSSYLGQFGSVPEALAAYNAGVGAVEQYGGVPPFPQTQAYVQTVLQRAGLGAPASGSAA